MAQTMDVSAILKRRAELLAVIEEGKTAGMQINLYNRIIVLKHGDRPVPGQADDAEDAAVPMAFAPNQVSLLPADYQPGTCPYCTHYVPKPGAQPSAAGIVRHINTSHPNTPEDALDALREANRGANTGMKRTVKSNGSSKQCPVAGCEKVFVKYHGPGVKAHLRGHKPKLSDRRVNQVAGEIEEALSP